MGEGGADREFEGGEGTEGGASSSVDIEFGFVSGTSTCRRASGATNEMKYLRYWIRAGQCRDGLGLYLS